MVHHAGRLRAAERIGSFSLVDKDKGAAVSVLNLGAGLAAFVGPLIVALFRNAIGYVGIVWFMAGLYILSAVMTYCIAPRNR